MKKKKMPWIFKLVIVAAVLFFFIFIADFVKKGEPIPRTGQKSILALDLKGILIDQQKFLKELRQYSQSEKIKGVLIRMDSPGGSVAVSQEIYHEFRRIHTVLKKPVVVSVGSMMASGALYAAAGASSVIVNSGTLVGSIGVIFPMINMGRLYDWAKMEPYSIKTGEFKDSGSNFRPMTSKERVLFQDLVNELLDQFKSALVEGRKISREVLEPYTDARIFTGEEAVSVGFADSIGIYSDAVELIGDMTNLGKNPKLFTPPPNYFDLFSSRFGSSLKNSFGLSYLMKQKMALLSFFGSYFSARPLYIFPPAIGM